MNELDGFSWPCPETEEPKRTMIPEAPYWGKVADVKKVVGDNIKFPTFSILVKITEDITHQSKYENRLVPQRIVFTPYYKDEQKTETNPGAGISRSFLKSIKQPYKGEGLKITPSSWKGLSFGFKIKHRAGKKGTAHEGKVFENMVFLTEEEYKKATTLEQTGNFIPEESIF